MIFTIFTKFLVEIIFTEKTLPGIESSLSKSIGKPIEERLEIALVTRLVFRPRISSASAGFTASGPTRAASYKALNMSF